MPDVYMAPEEKATGQTKIEPEVKANVVDEAKTEVKTDQVDPKAQVKMHIDDVLRRVGEIPRKELGGAYTVYPRSKFIQEQHDEEVVLMLRAHPITNFKWIVTVIGALLLPEILIGLGATQEFPFKVVFVARLVWYLMMLGFSFEKFLSWYYSVFIVTNERIIDIDFVNLLYRVMSYANLNHIEEPAMVAGGFIRSYFKYGDVHISTAADNPTVEGKGVPHPDKVIRIISELSEDLEKRRERGE